MNTSVGSILHSTFAVGIPFTENRPSNVFKGSVLNSYMVEVVVCVCDARVCLLFDSGWESSRQEGQCPKSHLWIWLAGDDRLTDG